MAPLTRRESVLLGIGAVAGTVAWASHRLGLYGLNANVDSVLHLVVGFGVGGLLYGGIAYTGMPKSRRRSALLIASLLVTGVLWELYEALPRPWGYGYVDRWFTPLYVNDTTADLALVMLGGFAVVWLGVNYRSDPASDTDDLPRHGEGHS